MLKNLNPKRILFLILTFALVSRVFLIWYPEAYVFDEVYHAFTAREYLKGSEEAWEYWSTPPEGVAYEWTHPPLAKEMMTLSMFLTRSTQSWAYRLPGVFVGVFSIYLLYAIAKQLFKKESIALLSAFLFSIDGLNFVQSRVGMNDIYLIAFMLASLLFILKEKFFISAIFLGLALASKWSAIYLLPLLFIILFWQKRYAKFLFFLIVPLLIYLASYMPFFILGHTSEQFIELQKQMWWYHTNLKATHDYTSPWWSWPLNLYPVWYFVDYKNDTIGNIFSSSNPIVFWAGAAAIILTIWDFIKTRSKNLAFIIIGFFIFWLPWAFSPRIMFLYHFSPSVPFLTLALGYQLGRTLQTDNAKITVIVLLLLSLLSFLIFYPFLVGIHLPKTIMLLFFETNLTKNPFSP